MKLKLKNVRIAFPKIFTAEPFPGGNDPTPYFSATGILGPDHPQLKEIRDAIQTIGKEKWGAKWPAIEKTIKANNKCFFKSGDTKADYEGFEGNWCVSARNKVRPTILGPNKEPVAESDGLFLGGYYVNMHIGVFAYTKGNNGIGASLMGLQHVRKGEVFGGGGTSSDDEFDEISAEETADDLME